MSASPCRPLNSAVLYYNASSRVLYRCLQSWPSIFYRLSRTMCESVFEDRENRTGGRRILSWVLLRSFAPVTSRANTCSFPKDKTLTHFSLEEACTMQLRFDLTHDRVRPTVATRTDGELDTRKDLLYTCTRSWPDMEHSVLGRSCIF